MGSTLLTASKKHMSFYPSSCAIEELKDQLTPSSKFVAASIRGERFLAHLERSSSLMMHDASIK